MTDIRDLVKGLIAIIVVVLSIGQLDRLHDFAKREAIKAMKPWSAHPFFPRGYTVRKRS